MLGRDKLHERAASPALSAGTLSDVDEDALGQATRCVRKFAPRGQSSRTNSGHITACKISDAYPNEIVVSWSGDHVYSFDMVHSPDASESPRDHTSTPAPNKPGRRVRESSERKRKRKTDSQASCSPGTSSHARSRQRTEDSTDGQGDVALRVKYQNGQSEDIPIERSASPISSLRESMMTDRQREAYRLAKTVVELRKTTFTLDSNEIRPLEGDLTGHAAEFTSARALATTLLNQVQSIHRSWRYPVNPAAEDVLLQRTLRSNRESTWRFVQASGVIARALGGAPHNTNQGRTNTELFARIENAPNESNSISRHERFGYDFLKAIFLWLDSGMGALIEGFTRSSDVSRYASRLPVPKDAGADAFDECIVPYLLAHSSNTPICNVDASRFEIDENRILYASERDAIKDFVKAVKTPFADLSSTNESANSSVPEPTQLRVDALFHWGLKVARGVLMNTGEGVNFAFVDRAFGGLGTNNSSAARDDARLRQRQQEIVPNEEDLAVESMELVDEPRTSFSESEEDVIAMSDIRAAIDGASDDEEDSSTPEDGSFIVPSSRSGDGHNERDDDDEDADASQDEDEGSDSDDNDGDEAEDDEFSFTGMMYQNAFNRRRKRGEVEKEVYCEPHIRTYRGHCNVKTVKDVNFFGLDDEYVVSGSDDGNLFIWDRKSAQLVNILEGDGEVVNVVQGHPYEPMMAVSGIDHTIKVFSPDARARDAARLGRGIEAADTSSFSSISWMRRRRQERQDESTSEPAVGASGPDDDEYVSANGLASRKRMHLEYQITSKNDVDRRGGNQETYITVSAAQG